MAGSLRCGRSVIERLLLTPGLDIAIPAQRETCNPEFCEWSLTSAQQPDRRTVGLSIFKRQVALILSNGFRTDENCESGRVHVSSVTVQRCRIAVSEFSRTGPKLKRAKSAPDPFDDQILRTRLDHKSIVAVLGQDGNPAFPEHLKWFNEPQDILNPRSACSSTIL